MRRSHGLAAVAARSDWQEVSAANRATHVDSRSMLAEPVARRKATFSVRQSIFLGHCGYGGEQPIGVNGLRDVLIHARRQTSLAIPLQRHFAVTATIGM